MTKLYWAVEDERAESLLAALTARGLRPTLSEAKNLMPVVEIDNPGVGLLTETFTLLHARVLTSAALMTEALVEEQLWIACEWHGKFVVDPACGEAIAALGVEALDAAKTAGRKLLIFLPPDPDAREIPKNRRSPVELYRADRWSVIDRPSEYYGRLASPDIGGANVLFAAGWEAARAREVSADGILVGEPEAFGFRMDESENSAIAWRARGVIAVHAVGFDLGEWSPALALGEELGVQEAVSTSRAQADAWLMDGCRFGLAIVLRGLEDPPVVIPTGSVYQQPIIGASVQNLATAHSVKVMVAAGATVPIVLPAYCLNPTFSPPAGPMDPTSLIYDAAAGTQSSVWRGIDQRYRGQP